MGLESNALIHVSLPSASCHIWHVWPIRTASYSFVHSGICVSVDSCLLYRGRKCWWGWQPVRCALSSCKRSAYVLLQTSIVPGPELVLSRHQSRSSAHHIWFFRRMLGYISTNLWNGLLWRPVKTTGRNDSFEKSGPITLTVCRKGWEATTLGHTWCCVISVEKHEGQSLLLLAQRSSSLVVMLEHTWISLTMVSEITTHAMQQAVPETFIERQVCSIRLEGASVTSLSRSIPCKAASDLPQDQNAGFQCELSRVFSSFFQEMHSCSNQKLWRLTVVRHKCLLQYL